MLSGDRGLPGEQATTVRLLESNLTKESYLEVRLCLEDVESKNLVGLEVEGERMKDRCKGKIVSHVLQQTVLPWRRDTEHKPSLEH